MRVPGGRRRKLRVWSRCGVVEGVLEGRELSWHSTQGCRNDYSGSNKAE